MCSRPGFRRAEVLLSGTAAALQRGFRLNVTSPCTSAACLAKVGTVTQICVKHLKIRKSKRS